jgi:16S rRNA A1518/A1519 N6-dimethyltransferase RsmA/KsgA/DIM1 with predicted DNA glycosylase/AP lyase activity
MLSYFLYFLLFFVLFLFLFFSLVFILIFLIFGLDILLNVFKRGKAPYVPIEKRYLKEILKKADLKKEDILCDLGSGDGKVLREAIKSFELKQAFGIELNYFIYLFSQFLNKMEGVDKKIKIWRGNFLNLPQEILEKTTVFYAYLFPSVLSEIFSNISSRLKKGTKVISVSFELKNYEKNFKLIKKEIIGWHTVYYYEKI